MTAAALTAAATATTTAGIIAVTASSEQAKYPPSSVTDGSNNTFWVSNGGKPGQGPTYEAPQWIQFRFSEPVLINQIYISGREKYSLREGELQSSNDGKNFSRLSSFTSSGARDVLFKFKASRGRYFRLVVNRAFDPLYPDSPRNVQISEVRFFGNDSAGNPSSWPPSDAPAPATEDWSAPGIVDPAALTVDGTWDQGINGQSFQQDAITSFKGWQYCTYYDSQGRVCLARRKLPKGNWQIIRFEDYRFSSSDSHNTISMGICPNDGTIHLAFDHHVSPLHYRFSKAKVATEPDKVKWTASLFGAVTDRFEFVTKGLSYPMFLQTPNGNLQVFYRSAGSGLGEWWMVDYFSNSSSGPGWRRTRRIDSGAGNFVDQFGESKSRNAYPNAFQYDGDGRLHYTWTWRENSKGANHDICYAYSDDGGLTWANDKGEIVNTGDGKKFINISSPGIVVVPIDSTRSLMNQQAQAIDSQGRVHIVMWHRRDGAPYNNLRWSPSDACYYHYWRSGAGNWKKMEIPSEVGNRPQLLFDASDNAYAIYSVNRNPRIWDNILYYVDGQICIASATASSGWTDWKVIYTHQKGSFMNELRADAPLFASGGPLSIMTQHAPRSSREPTPLRVIDITPKR